MKLIVGLGNPGSKYDKTRHNAGFMVLDKLAESLKVSFNKEGFSGVYGVYGTGEDKVFLLKPSTYMNLSGESVMALVNFYKIPVEDIIVVHDDMDLPVGKIRIRKSGSSGGQKGMGNIIDLLHTQDIKRIRVGIGKDKNFDVCDYVLSRFKDEEKEELEKALDKASKALVFSLKNNFDLVMNRYNG